MGETKRYAHLFFIFFFFCYFSFIHATTDSDSDSDSDSYPPQLTKNDMDTMLALSKHLPLLSPNINYWNTTDPNPCLWGDERVNCSDSRVVKLDLDSLGLYTSTTNSSSAAQFFELLCRLDALQDLYLSYNSFVSIPTFFYSNCTGLSSSLRRFHLYGNNLTGPLGNFSSFRSLECLDMFANTLEGPITSQLDGLVNLTGLNLANNFLNGTIPIHSSLKKLILSGNCFQGRIPIEISKMSNLTHLDLSGNRLSGLIPDEISKLPKLSILNLSENSFVAKIPESLTFMETLKQFYAASNNFTGSIPTGIPRYLMELDLSNNYFDGEIPSAIFALTQLSSLNLEHNRLNGSIPDTILTSYSLTNLQLGNNRLSGTIPRMPSSLSLVLNLSNNLFGGPIPWYLGNLNHLGVLDLSKNRFTGEVPISLTKMDNLNKIVLSDNQLSGVLPQFPGWIDVVCTGNNFTADSNEAGITRISISKHDILIMVAAFVGGFVTSIFASWIVQEMVSKFFYKAKAKNKSAGVVIEHSSRPGASTILENLRKIHRQLYAGNRGQGLPKCKAKGNRFHISS